MRFNLRYVQEMINISELAPMHRQFYKVFIAFKIAEKGGTLTSRDLYSSIKDADKKKDMKTKDNFADEDDLDEVSFLPILQLNMLI